MTHLPFLPMWTVGRCLKRWGLTPQKPARRVYEQDPAAVRRWLEVDIRRSENRPKRKGRRFTGVMRWRCARTIRGTHLGPIYASPGLGPIWMQTNRAPSRPPPYPDISSSKRVARHELPDLLAEAPVQFEATTLNRLKLINSLLTSTMP
jgi:Winged helix-turn helix